jgi:hemerythrin
MSVQWTKDLQTDIPEIDSQHKELLSRIDGLIDAWAGGRGLAEVERVLKFLEEYTTKHFKTEEQYMTRYAYSNRTAHMAQHGVFVKSFEKLKKRYFQTGADAELIAETNDLIVDWFRNHIRYVDRAFALFLKIKMHEIKAA